MLNNRTKSGKVPFTAETNDTGALLKASSNKKNPRATQPPSQIIIKTRKYSRRQIQWFRKEKVDATIDVSQLDRDQITENILDVLHEPERS